MFGIGLPEMIVILAVALIVVGPDKLPELARSLAKGMNELKKTMNQVKENLSEETKVITSVQEDLQKTAGRLTHDLLDDESRTWLPADRPESEDAQDEIEADDLQPLEERPWEKDANAVPQGDSAADSEDRQEVATGGEAGEDTTDQAPSTDSAKDSSAAA